MRLGPLFLSVVAGAALASAQEGPSERDRKLQEKVDALRGKVEEATGVKFKAKVPAAYQGRDEFAKFLAGKVAKEYPPEKMEADTRLYRLLGLIPEGFDLVKTMVDMMKTQAGAYYDPETKRMYVLGGEMPEAVLDGVLFHELVHAAQDQEHDLVKSMKALEKGNNDDALVGYRFLVEGEASFWMQVHMLKSMGQGPEMMALVVPMMKDLTTKGIIQLMEMQAGTMGDSMPELKEAAGQLKKIPSILIRSLMDPYLRGMCTAYHIHRTKGGEGFRALFRNPPAWSTRDFMFGEEWLESPRGIADVRLGPLGEVLGEGWKKSIEDSLGALALHVLFEDQRRAADAVAKAWDGGRLQVWQGGGKSFVAGVVAFASPEAASTFAKQLERLYREQWTKGEKIEEVPGEGTRLSCGEDRFWVKADGTRASFYRGAVPGDGSKVAEALLKSEVAAPKPVEKR